MDWTPRRTISWLLAAATLIPLVALGWLGLRIFQQDRELERQRRRESLEFAAGRLSLDIERRLVEIEEQLAQGSGVRLTASGLEPGGGAVTLYGPELPRDREVSATVFSEAEALEFTKQDLAGAVAAYRRLADSSSPSERGGALVRLGRVLRKQGDRKGALSAYSRLEALGDVAIAGQPAELLARQGRCRTLEESGDAAGLRQQAGEIARRLNSGSWRIDRATFDLYREMAEQWGGPAPNSDAVARSEAAIVLWRAWQSGELPARGRKVLQGEIPVLALWAGGPQRPTVRLATPADLEVLLAPLWKPQALAVSFEDAEGRPFLGTRPEHAIVLSPVETHLPFILRMAPLSETVSADRRARAGFLVAGLFLTFALMLAAGYGLYRTTTRELALARLQSDFISAVSHEFRTPLTSMRHLTEMLVSRGVPSEERRTQYYQLLSQETERLHRMVESLLSFGRIEAGAYAWRLEALDAAELVRSVVEEFQREAEAKDRQVVIETHGELPPVRADREALARALWNLLENAAKYSEPDAPIRVSARTSGPSVLVAVEDRGIGIPAAEQETVFQKFVRGSEAKRAGVRGVGVGLALVERIMEAHGGSVRLESESGRGSTFTLVLPCLES